MFDQATADAASQVVNTTVTSQFAGAAAIGYLLNWLKESDRIPWISAHTKWLNRILVGVLSFITAIGVHYTFDPAAGTLIIGGLHASTIGHGLLDWGTQWIMAQMSSDIVLTKRTAEAVQTGDVNKPTGIKLASDKGTGGGGL